MTTDEARERAARGAALLDEKKPGWREKVNPETLEMSSGCHCILGQVYENFEVGGGNLRWDGWRDLGDLGFLAASIADYVILQDAWLEQISGTARLPGRGPRRVDPWTGVR